MRRLVNIGGGGLHEEEIHQAVLVVVEPGHAGAHCLEIIFFVGLRGVLKEGDASLSANVGIADGNGSFLRFWSWPGEEEQMGGGSEYGGERQDCAEFDCGARNGSSGYLQFAPIPPGCVAGIPSLPRIHENSGVPIRVRILAPQIKVLNGKFRRGRAV